MNRLSEYISGMKLTRQLLVEARVASNEGKETKAIRYLIDSFDAFVRATSCVVSINTGRKPKRGTK